MNIYGNLPRDHAQLVELSQFENSRVMRSNELFLYSHIFLFIPVDGRTFFMFLFSRSDQISDRSSVHLKRCIHSGCANLK